MEGLSGTYSSLGKRYSFSIYKTYIEASYFKRTTSTNWDWEEYRKRLAASMNAKIRTFTKKSVETALKQQQKKLEVLTYQPTLPPMLKKSRSETSKELNELSNVFDGTSYEEFEYEDTME